MVRLAYCGYIVPAQVSTDLAAIEEKEWSIPRRHLKVSCPELTLQHRHIGAGVGKVFSGSAGCRGLPRPLLRTFSS